MPANGHGERLSAIDASFLQLESAQAHMHVAWSAIFAPPAGGKPPTIDAHAGTSVSARLRWVPRCRQRLLPAPLGFGEPCWVDDDDFDVRAHIVELSDPSEAMGPPASRSCATSCSPSRSIAAVRCGRWRSSHGSPTAGSPSSVACTTRWPTARPRCRSRC